MHGVEWELFSQRLKATRDWSWKSGSPSCGPPIIIEGAAQQSIVLQWMYKNKPTRLSADPLQAAIGESARNPRADSFCLGNRLLTFVLQPILQVFGASLGAGLKVAGPTLMDVICPHNGLRFCINQ